jgi:hypothetical protein
MNLRVADVACHGVHAVLSLDRHQATSNFIKGFVPRDRFPARCGSSHGMADSVWILVDIFDAERFRTDMSSTERIFFVAAYREYGLVT